MKAYTPGPWRVGDAKHTVFGPKRPEGGAPEIIASVKPKNAAIIAAAPALLAGAKWALSNLAEPLHEWSAYAREYRALEAAIAEAEAK